MNAPRPLLVASAFALAAGPLLAQNCPCPPTLTPGWHGSAGAGLALTSGNSDTQSYNVNLALVYDPKKHDLAKIDGLYLKARVDGEDTAEKAAFGARGEHRLGRAFLFAEARVDRDRFKQLLYLASPSAGVGYKLVDRPRATLGVDAGVGLAFEKLSAREGTSSGALRASESLILKVTDNTQITETARALWKTDDFADAFYHLEAGLANSISQRLELKVGLLMDVKNKPAAAGLEKTDKALLASLVLKL
jgi:putative salt-induced outer membrane protein